MSEEQDDDETQGFRARVVDLGFLDSAVAEDAYYDYRQGHSETTFASYLMQRKLITLSQLALLAKETPSKTTVAGAFTDPEIGKTYSGCVVEQLLGRGGMGAVYLARRQSDHELFVIKVLSPNLAWKENLRARFQREGEVLRSLPPHPHIVSVPLVDTEDDRPHILMDYVEGLSLERILEERWSLLPLEAARVVRDIALGMSIVHEHGVIHRDMKPANVLLTPEGVAKIVDFGLAKDLYADGLTQAGQKLGTPYYMAPEQWGDHEVDARCDVFALGATFYHLLVGEPPFQGQNKDEIADRILAGEYVPPRRVVPELSHELELVILQMLMPDRRFRYPSMKAVSDDLTRVLDGRPPRVPCLFKLNDDDHRGRRYPLVPGKSFTIGREIDCEAIVPDSSVSRRHAVLRRESTGFVLRDLGSTFGSYVNDMRIVRPVGLKTGDRLRLGRIKLEFLNPFETAKRKETASQADVRRERLPEPAFDALVSLGDKRSILQLLERLTEDSAAMNQAVHHLEGVLGAEVALEVKKELKKQGKRARARAPMLLFALTNENYANDVGGWLAWWDTVRAERLEQVGPAQPPHLLRLRIIKGEAGISDLALDDAGGVFQLGRDEGCQLPLSNRTVSRLHATIFRMHRRFVIRDEGSRLGTVVNGDRVRLAFLDPGDVITLGSVQAVVELQGDERPPSPGVGLQCVEPHVFDALIEIEHPSTATALVGFLHEKDPPEWAAWTAAALYPADDELASKYVHSIQRLYADRKELALELLPKLLGEDRGAAPGAWSQLLAQRRSDLGPQLLPTGWLQGTRDLYAGSNAGSSIVPQ